MRHCLFAVAICDNQSEGVLLTLQKEAEIAMRNVHTIYRHYHFLELRDCIGKTDDVHESLCMHSSIVAREMAQKGVIVCRVCTTPLPEGKGRFNDHIVLKHPECVQPICSKCARERPDKFHLAFKHGVSLMHNLGLGFPPLFLKAASMAADVELAKRGIDPNHPEEQLCQ